MTAALAAPPRPDQDWRGFFRALDPRWEQPATWARLARAIETPPELTEVVYVYRNVTNGRPIEYREMLAGDLTARCGGLPLRRCLEPASLSRIFAR